MPGSAAKVVITERQQEVLLELARASTTAKAVAVRASVILLAFLRQPPAAATDAPLFTAHPCADRTPGTAPRRLQQRRLGDE